MAASAVAVRSECSGCVGGKNSSRVCSCGDIGDGIELNPNAADSYESRSIFKESLGDLTGACADAKKAISLGSNSSVKWISENCN